jgi:hypothetical protein
MDPYQLQLGESASDAMERLLAQQTCPIHVHTTLNSAGDCPMCRVDSLPASPWVARAQRGALSPMVAVR